VTSGTLWLLAHLQCAVQAVRLPALRGQWSAGGWDAHRGPSASRAEGQRVGQTTAEW
jgi:hypothetical protein